YKAVRTLMPHLARFQLPDRVRLFVVNPTVTARLLHPDVKPDRRIEARLLRQHQVRQFGPEILGVRGAGEITVLQTPAGDGVHHTTDKLPHAVLALRSPDLSVKILARNDVRGRLRPVHRYLDIALLENNGTFIVADGRRTRLPLDFVVRCLPGLQTRGEIAGKYYPGFGFGVFDHFFHFGTHADGQLSHVRCSYLPVNDSRSEERR